MTNHVELFLHVFFWLPFITPRYCPPLMFYLVAAIVPTKQPRDLEEWRIKRVQKSPPYRKKSWKSGSRPAETKYQNRKKSRNLRPNPCTGAGSQAASKEHGKHGGGGSRQIPWMKPLSRSTAHARPAWAIPAERTDPVPPRRPDAEEPTQAPAS